MYLVWQLIGLTDAIIPADEVELLAVHVIDELENYLKRRRRAGPENAIFILAAMILRVCLPEWSGSFICCS